MNVAEYEHKAATRRLLVRAGQVLFLAVVVIPVALWCASLG